MTLLINKSDFADYRAVSANRDDKRIDPFIQEAQEFELRGFLGDPLYYDMLAKIDHYNTEKESNPDYVATADEQKYLDLLNGVSYEWEGNTIQFKGVKPVLVYYAYSRFLSNNNIVSTRFGAVQKKNDYSDPIDSREMARVITKAESDGKKYGVDVERFLNTKSADYPKWEDRCGSRRKLKGLGFRIGRV